MNYRRWLQAAAIVLTVACVLAADARLISAQERMGYRTYVLGSTIESVMESSGASAIDVKKRYEQPALIQELEWRPQYAWPATAPADPVRYVVFSFCDGAMYQVLVSYDSSRTDGLSNGDVIAALTEAYGIPVPAATRNRPLEAASDTVVLAQWDRADSTLTLLRRVYQPDFQLLLTSKVLATRARSAIQAAEKLAVADAPRLEREQRKRESEAATAALEKVRAANKAAFRP
jgi:hypothetical protein